MKMMCKKVWLVLLTVLFMIYPNAALAGPQPEPPTDVFDINNMILQSDFIFKGHVLDVSYKEAPWKPVLDENQQPVMEDGQVVYRDGSGMPYTFVTYGIEEFYKGFPPLQNGQFLEKVTLRFAGGRLTSDPNDVILVSHYPLFDPGDRDLLFVKGNTQWDCPLVDEDRGRWRLIVDPLGPNQETKVFDEWTCEIVIDLLSPNTEVRLGPPHLLEDALINSFGPDELERVVTYDPDLVVTQNNPDPPRLGTQFNEADMTNFIWQRVFALYTQEELQKIPPVVNADINQPVPIISLVPDAPQQEIPFQQPVEDRAWLDTIPDQQKQDILQAEALEMELLRLNGGNPVLPQDPCQEFILRNGALEGDISGPQNRPDCRVDLYDLRVIALQWLVELGPNNP